MAEQKKPKIPKPPTTENMTTMPGGGGAQRKQAQQPMPVMPPPPPRVMPPMGGPAPVQLATPNAPAPGGYGAGGMQGGDGVIEMLKRMFGGQVG